MVEIWFRWYKLIENYDTTKLKKLVDFYVPTSHLVDFSWLGHKALLPVL